MAPNRRNSRVGVDIKIPGYLVDQQDVCIEIPAGATASIHDKQRGNVKTFPGPGVVTITRNGGVVS